MGRCDFPHCLSEAVADQEVAYEELVALQTVVEQQLLLAWQQG